MTDAHLSAALMGHATHPDAHMALALAAAQLEAQRAQRPGFEARLGLLYLTEAYAGQAEALLDEVRQRWPGLQVAGTVGVGIAATGVEYWDEPALALLLLNLPAEQFRIFSGRHPLEGEAPWTALVHADPATQDLSELVGEMAARTGSGQLFGGVASARNRAVQLANGVFAGGLSGVAFGPGANLVSRMTQGCQPIGPTRTVTAAERNLVLTLDEQPALLFLLKDLGMRLSEPDPLMQRLRSVLAGLTDAGDTDRARGGQFGVDTRVRHLVGLDPTRQAVAIADWVEPGQQLAFCQRDVEAARRDLVRICAEIRDELAGDEEAGVPARRPVGALYISCTGRGGGHFGGPSAELQIVRHALGDVPLVGFFAAGEIAGRHLVGYTGVLTVFAAPEAPEGAAG